MPCVSSSFFPRHTLYLPDDLFRIIFVLLNNRSKAFTGFKADQFYVDISICIQISIRIEAYSVLFTVLS